jgi:hypothetical protein
MAHRTYGLAKNHIYIGKFSYFFREAIKPGRIDLQIGLTQNWDLATVAPWLVDTVSSGSLHDCCENQIRTIDVGTICSPE